MGKLQNIFEVSITGQVIAVLDFPNPEKYPPAQIRHFSSYPKLHPKTGAASTSNKMFQQEIYLHQHSRKPKR